jgi:hypothetical protein
MADIKYRLGRTLDLSEKKKLERVDQHKAKRGRSDLPPEERKLSQGEAAAYCGVSPATIHRWTKEGLKTVSYGKWKWYTIPDLKAFMAKRLKQKKG